MADREFYKSRDWISPPRLLFGICLAGFGFIFASVTSRGDAAGTGMAIGVALALAGVVVAALQFRIRFAPDKLRLDMVLTPFLAFPVRTIPFEQVRRLGVLRVYPQVRSQRAVIQRRCGADYCLHLCAMLGQSTVRIMIAVYEDYGEILERLQHRVGRPYETVQQGTVGGIRWPDGPT